MVPARQARTSPPGLPGAHPISATGQNPEMAVPTPLPPNPAAKQSLSPALWGILLKLVGKKMSDIKVVANGAGAAGIAIIDRKSVV